MKKIEDYINYIFEENQEDIKQYILKQTDIINFKINKNNNTFKKMMIMII